MKQSKFFWWGLRNWSLEVDLSVQVYWILSELSYPGRPWDHGRPWDPGRPEDPGRPRYPGRPEDPGKLGYPERPGDSGRTEDQVWNWNFCDLLFYSLLVRFW